MRAYDVILNKRNGKPNSAEEIEYLIKGYTHGEIPESQVAAWLMAVYFRGMDSRETADLTMSIVRSGRMLDLGSIPGIKVDKHSTGGVGDKTTLVLGPLLAAAGVPVVKVSGRSLGYTGGTLDKLESIPGYITSLTPDEMIEQVKRIRISLAGQTLELVPADKKLYALRDLTATVDSIPLIAASVMSKKIACGADAIVLDVKVGSGAFMQTVPEAVELAKSMVAIGRHLGRSTVAAITDMDQPLGCAVGNAIEVVEAIRTLRGEGPQDLLDLCVLLGGIALVLANKASRREDGEKIILNLIENGQGAEKLRELIVAQKGDPRVVDDPSLLNVAPVAHTVVSTQSGYVSRLDALSIAKAATALGAGRSEQGAHPDLSVGIYLLKKRGDNVVAGAPLAEIHASRNVPVDLAAELIQEAYSLSDLKPDPQPVVYELVE